MRCVVEYERVSVRVSAVLPLLAILGVCLYTHPPNYYIYVTRFSLLSSAAVLLSGIPILFRAYVIRSLNWKRDDEVIFLGEAQPLRLSRVLGIVGYFITVATMLASAILYKTPILFVLLSFLISAIPVDVGLQLKGFFVPPFRVFFAVDASGFTVRGVEGRICSFNWEERPRVLGVNRRASLVFSTQGAKICPVGLYSLPIRYSAIERIVDFYRDHPEERAALGTEEGLKQVERLSR